MKSYKIIEKKEFDEAAALFEVKPDIAFFVSSKAGTKEISKIILDILEAGMLVGVSGQLGAGKTEFVRSLLADLGFKKGVSSPSFILETEYEILKKTRKNKDISLVSHWDLYRLKQETIPPEISEKVLAKKTLTLVEWPGKIPAIRDLLSLEVMIAMASFLPQLSSDSEEERIIGVKFYRQDLYFK